MTMATKKSTPIDVDPMAILKEKKKEKSRQRKIKLTGKTEAHCKECDETKDIVCFDIYKNKKGIYHIRFSCRPCTDKRRKFHSKKGDYKKRKKVRKWVKKNSKKASKLITDAYIKRLYSKWGYKFKDVTPEMIITKRKEIIDRRYNAIHNGYKKKKAEGYYDISKRATLPDSYIKTRIKDSAWYKGEEITDKMIQDRKEQIEIHRLIKKAREERSKQKTYTFNTRA